MPRLNITGPALVKLRLELGLTQEMAAARLQCKGVNISRQMLANMESGRTQVTDKHLIGFQKVFGTRIMRLFPLMVQLLEEQIGENENNQPLKRSR